MIQIKIKDQFDSAAEWLLAHLAAWEVNRRGFSMIESPDDKRERTGIVAEFLRHDFWNQPDGSLPALGKAFVLPLPIQTP